jgi:hypothetical protein
VIRRIDVLKRSSPALAYPAALLASCLQRWPEAEQHFEEALEINERPGARPWIVRTRRGYAEMLLHRNAPGDRDRAAELIAAGRAEAEQLAWRARSCGSTGCRSAETCE